MVGKYTILSGNSNFKLYLNDLPMATYTLPTDCLEYVSEEFRVNGHCDLYCMHTVLV